MSTAIKKRVEARGAISRAQAQAIATQRAELRHTMHDELQRYQTAFERLQRHYGRNLPFSTTPEASARALFVYGRKAQILEERDRPAFVRSWG